MYGHGAPKTVKAPVRAIIALLSDTLFLLITQKLLQAVSCYSIPGEERGSVLMADHDIVCYQDPWHRWLVFASLVSLSYYIPMAISELFFAFSFV